jgi:uncharacterized protein (TIGR00255 family)
LAPPIAVSAVTGEGLDALKAAIEAKVSGELQSVTVTLAPAELGLVDWLYRNGDIVSRIDNEDGSVTISLNAEGRDGAQEIRLNEAALMQVVKATERIRALTGADAPRADGLIAIKGVLEVVERQESEAEAQERTSPMLATLEEALSALVRARAAEGERLKTVLISQIDDMERLVAAVEVSPARTPAAIEKRLAEQVSRLIDPATGFDPVRLHQEAVLLATRADVEEELKRLRSHIKAARDLLDEDGAVGRKLDFLAQEFNREANTLCSKANDVEITRSGLALKTLIDQMREQVQNIE